MRFEFYHAGLDSLPKLSVDGTVPNSIHFSHWLGNTTPPELKADTSTEIALNLVASSRSNEFTQEIELVTNNHFDTDGVLSVWTVLAGDRALELCERLVPAAEAGDFSEFTNEAAIRASIAIQGSDQAGPDDQKGSPLAAYLAGEEVDDEARAYELVLPEVERLLTRIDDYQSLWRKGWERIALAIESFEIGKSRVEEIADTCLSLIFLAPEVFSSKGFNPTKHAAPYTAISRYARGELLLVTTPVKDGWIYRLDYPYYSWAETIVRPAIERRDLRPAIAKLNQNEPAREVGSWKLDNRELTAAVKFLDHEGIPAASRIPPEQVADAIQEELSL